MLSLCRLVYCLVMMLFLTFTTFALASDTTWMPSSKIHEFSQVVKTIKDKYGYQMPTVVRVPYSSKPLYAVLEVVGETDSKRSWIISITTDPKCVAKICMIGSLSASSGESLDKRYTQAPLGPNSKTLPKQAITMPDGLVMYYTPGHAEADWHPPTLEWEYSGQLFRLSWNLENDDKHTLLEMLSKEKHQ